MTESVGCIGCLTAADRNALVFVPCGSGWAWLCRRMCYPKHKAARAANKGKTR